MAVTLNLSQGGSEQILMFKDSHPKLSWNCFTSRRSTAVSSFKYSSQNPKPQS